MHSQNKNIFPSLLVRTMPYVRLPMQVKPGVMMDHALMKRLVVQHQHATKYIVKAQISRWQ
jgi:hypothetical protein